MEGNAKTLVEKEASQLAPAVETPWQLLWKRLRKQRIAMFGGVVLIFLYAATIIAGFLAPYGYERQDRDRFFHPPTWPKLQGFRFVVPRYQLQADGQFKYQRSDSDVRPIHFFVTGEKYKLVGLIPASLHLFGTDDSNYPVYLCGTDQFGRDIFSRMMYGAEISLSIGVIGIAFSYLLGVIMGGISGYFIGLVDDVTMRVCELIMSIPALYLIIALRAVFPPKMSSVQMYMIIVIILSFIRWAGTARVIRGMVLSLRERQFVLAAKSLGQSNWRIITRHILPGTFSFLIIAATLGVPYYILGEVVLSFLGVGIQEPNASWGVMLNEAQNPDYLHNYPWLLAPGVAIFITVLAFNFLGDGLRDALDTKG